MNACRRPLALLGSALLCGLAGCSGGDTALPEPSRSTVTSTAEATQDAQSTAGTSSTAPAPTTSPSSSAAAPRASDTSITGAPMDHNDGEQSFRGTCGEVITREGAKYQTVPDQPGTDCSGALAALQEYLDGMPYTDNGNAQVVMKDGNSCSTPTYGVSHDENVIFRCTGPFGGIRVPLNP